jgi:hypothetical protein
VFAVLSNLARVPRFDIVVSFLDDREKQGELLRGPR